MISCGNCRWCGWPHIMINDGIYCERCKEYNGYVKRGNNDQIIGLELGRWCINVFVSHEIVTNNDVSGNMIFSKHD